MLCGQTDGRQTCRCADTTPPRGVQEIRRRVSNPQRTKPPKQSWNIQISPFWHWYWKKQRGKFPPLPFWKRAEKMRIQMRQRTFWDIWTEKFRLTSLAPGRWEALGVSDRRKMVPAGAKKGRCLAKSLLCIAYVEYFTPPVRIFKTDLIILYLQLFTTPSLYTIQSHWIHPFNRNTVRYGCIQSLQSVQSID